LPLNAAVADRRLDGKRSQRVEALCRAHGGKGSPCDVLSIHAYNRSAMMAAKLIRAKEVALEIDPDYYRALWVNSHESCPDWLPPPDEAATDAYLGNGYFPSWCADVVHRQLLRAAGDPRYAYGETILTVWPPPANIAGLNAITRVIHCDDDGDRRADRTVTIPMPIFHALGLLSDLGDRYWVLPERVAAGHVTSGFASRDDQGVVRILLYAHHAQDTQSRSEESFAMTLDLEGLGWAGPARVEETRFDRDHNSPFRLIRAILDRPAPGGQPDAARLAEVNQGLESGDPAAQLRALETLRQLDAPTRQAALPAVFTLAGRAKDQGVRDAATAILRSAMGPVGYPAAEVEAIRKQSGCHPTGTSTQTRQANGHLRLTVRVAANGCNFVVIRPGEVPPKTSGLPGQMAHGREPARPYPLIGSTEPARFLPGGKADAAAHRAWSGRESQAPAATPGWHRSAPGNDRDCPRTPQPARTRPTAAGASRRSPCLRAREQT
jgi:hypothetical protein